MTTEEVSDGKYLKSLVEKSKKQEIQVKEVLADGVYSSKENLKYMAQEDIKAITPLHPIILNAGQIRCPVGHLSVRKSRTGKKNQKTNQSLTYYFDIEKYKTCPLREGCYKPGA